MHPFTLERPRDLSAALASRAQAGRNDAPAEYIAGGTDMVQLLQEDLRSKRLLRSTGHIMLLAFDRWRINDLKRELGCYVPREPHGQGYMDMSPAVDIVRRLVIQRKLRYGAHPVLQWCAANAVITRDLAGGRKFDKAKSTGRIDALVALAMALSLPLLKAAKPIDIEALALRRDRT